MKYQKKPVVIEAKRFDTTAMFEELSKLHEWVTGEYFKAIRSYRQERRYKYKVNGKKALVENKILFKSCSDFHLQITTKQGIINYYPSTGEGK